MNALSWKDSIWRDLQDLSNDEWYFSYVLPRQIGSTTFILGVADSLKRTRHNVDVLYVSHNLDNSRSQLRSYADFKKGESSLSYTNTARSLSGLEYEFRGKSGKHYFIILDNVPRGVALDKFMENVQAERVIGRNDIIVVDIRSGSAPYNPKTKVDLNTLKYVTSRLLDEGISIEDIIKKVAETSEKKKPVATEFGVSFKMARRPYQ